MKKSIVFFVFCLFVLFFAFSCKTKKVVTSEQPKTQAEEVKSNTLSYFKQGILRGINERDSILVYKNAAFLNSCEIKLEKNISNQSFYVDQKGSVLKVDTLTEAQKTVSALTVGKQTSIRISSTYRGLIMIINVAFSQNDANYQFSFWITEDGRFVLNGNSFITVNGHKYPVTAKTTTTCYLMFNFDTKTVPKPVKSQAEGWTGTSTSGSSPNVPTEQNKQKDVEGFQPSFVPTNAKP
jgi:hypothetical protein